MSKIYFESFRDFAIAIQSVLPTADIDETRDGQLIIYTNLMENNNENIVEWED